MKAASCDNRQEKKARGIDRNHVRIVVTYIDSETAQHMGKNVVCVVNLITLKEFVDQLRLKQRNKTSK